jgi:hypothetical protein
MVVMILQAEAICLALPCARCSCPSLHPIRDHDVECLSIMYIPKAKLKSHDVRHPAGTPLPPVMKTPVNTRLNDERAFTALGWGSCPWQSSLAGGLESNVSILELDVFEWVNVLW